MRRLRKRLLESDGRPEKSACTRFGRGKPGSAKGAFPQRFQKSNPRVPVLIPIKSIGSPLTNSSKIQRPTGLHERKAGPRQISKEPNQVMVRRVRGTPNQKGDGISKRPRNMMRTGAYSVHIPPDRMQDYLPVTQEPFREVGASEMAEMNARWKEIIKSGRSYRDEAIQAVGPMLTPQDAAMRLGVSKATLSNWRRQNKLLGLSFDDHQYLYPIWQFVDSLSNGERGVLRFLREVLTALGDTPPWEKALFFVTQTPSLGGRTPLEVLRRSRKEDINRLCQVASHNGEMGS